MDYKMLSELISKPWMDTEGIMTIAHCCNHNATKIRKDIEQQVIDSGKKLPLSSRKYVPTKLVLEYLGLDEDYIFNMASRTV